jgi:hypothetical protein
MLCLIFCIPCIFLVSPKNKNKNKKKKKKKKGKRTSSPSKCCTKTINK